MARKQDENLIPFTSDQSREQAAKNGTKGGKKSGEVRRQKKTIADFLKTWADKEVDEKNKKALQALGLDEEATNRTLLVLPLIKKANGGDIKALQMIIDLLGEDKKKDLEIKKLQEEIALLRAEKQKITAAFGEDREIEDLSGLAEMLRKDKGGEEDDE